MNQQPLGALLVRRGLITEEQLAAALADQLATGAPLGQIVVSRGYAASAAVAQALATQHGGLLKTEYGFATGFDSGGPPKPFVPPPVTSDAVAESRVLTPVAKAAVELVPDEVAVAEPEPDREALRAEVSSATEREALRAEVSSATEEAEKLRADNERLTELRSNLEQRLASEAQRAASLERELAAAKEQINSATEGGPLRDDDSRISELEAALAARDAAIDKWEAGIAERDGALEEFRVAAEEWKTALAGRDEALAELAAGRDDALTQLREAKGALATWEAAVHELTVAWDEAVAQARTAAADEAAVQNARISGLALERDKALEKLEAAEAAQSEVVELGAPCGSVTRCSRSGRQPRRRRRVSTSFARSATTRSQLCTPREPRWPTSARRETRRRRARWIAGRPHKAISCSSEARRAMSCRSAGGFPRSPDRSSCSSTAPTSSLVSARHPGRARGFPAHTSSPDPLLTFVVRRRPRAGVADVI